MARTNTWKQRVDLLVVLFLSALIGACGGGNGSEGTSPDATVDPTPTYTVSGTLSGLAGSSPVVVLQLNGMESQTLYGNGPFSFSDSLADTANYQVTVVTQPTGGIDQWCNVLDAAGAISQADVTEVRVICTSGAYNVVDTNQTLCYDSATGAQATCVGAGYDADYSGNQPSYTLSVDEAVVHDNVTGLVWTQTPDLTGNGVVDSSDKLTQPDAVSYCSNLTTGGYDWRLPTIKDLYSLMDFSGTDPSGYSGSDTSVTTPFIDPVFTPGFGDQGAGERLIDGQYATTSLYVSPLGTMGGNATMFGVNFVDGRIKGYPYAMPPSSPKTFYVHCVSGSARYGTNTFVDNLDGTVTDQATDLTWQQSDYPSTNFEDAVTYCESAGTGGYTDWRLPDVKELQSIVDYSRSPDSSNSAALDPVFTATAITNEEGVGDWGYYWASTTHANSTGDGSNATYVSFGRAAGYFQDPMTRLSAFDDVHGAGAQRSNDKQHVASGASVGNLGYGDFYYLGPQGDVLRLDNMVRCVR